MRFFLFTSLLTACGTPGDTERAVQADAQPVVNAMTAIDVDPLVAWVEQPGAMIGALPECPSVRVIEQTAESIHELWTGDCALADGRTVVGELERFDSPEGAWIVGRDFRVFEGDELLAGLDGAIEIIPTTNALWLIEVAAATCGASNWRCEQGVLGLDLSYTIYPAIGFPLDYDTTVSGTVATESGTTTLNGAWSIDRSACADEPTSGMLSLYQGSHHGLTHNGQDQCDGCAAWEIQGQEAPLICPTSL